MAPVFSAAGKLGSEAIDFELPGVDGKTYRLNDFQGAKALVIAFMCNHCPYVIAVQDRINLLAKEYKSKGVSLVGINSNDSVKYPDDSFEAMKIRAQERNYIFPYLRDESQLTARAYGAICTPEFYAYESVQGKFVLRYLGRLDDSWKDETAVQKRELALALDRILNGELPDSDQKPAMGCSIKWK